jgi:hypothetical protein
MAFRVPTRIAELRTDRLLFVDWRDRNSRAAANEKPYITIVIVLNFVAKWRSAEFVFQKYRLYAPMWASSRVSETAESLVSSTSIHSGSISVISGRGSIGLELMLGCSPVRRTAFNQRSPNSSSTLPNRMRPFRSGPTLQSTSEGNTGRISEESTEETFCGNL